MSGTNAFFIFSNDGVFKSTNGGASWQPVSNGLNPLNFSALAVDPVNPTTLYVGTYGLFIFSSGPFYIGDGVFKSSNDGAGWQAVNNGLKTRAISALAVDPINPATVYAGTYGGGVFKITFSEIPEQPVYLNPLSPVMVPPEKSKNLILLIHGWNSDPQTWANEMGINIAQQLIPGYSGNPCKDGVETNTAIWQICAIDWSVLSAFPPYTPWGAYIKAMLVGEALAPKIVENRYDFILFIAHSAGSELAHSASTNIKIIVDQYNAKNQTTPIIKPVIHTTFLDAYDPLGASSFYGDASDWSEQYVDYRQTGLFPGRTDYTRIQLPGAYNFDVTDLDPNSTDILGIEAHKWPYKFYNSTTLNKNLFDYGFVLAKAAGGNPSPTQYPRGKKCIALKVDGICSESAELAVQTQKMIIIGDVLNYINIADALMSPEGTISLVANTILKLITGAPVWISIPIVLPEPVDVISFDYTFIRQAEGLLTVLFDDQIVYNADERLKQVGVSNFSGDVPIGDIKSGTHTLFFRLDAYNGTQSEIDISDVQLGKMTVVTNQKPTANAGPDQTARLGSLVTLTGSASADPDNGPSPLSFVWTQTAGPTVTLAGATSVTPKFTPTGVGSYTFSLTVNDGQSDSAADVVTITAPKLGDIDLDSDVDNNDLNLILAARNTPANGPNDLRDLNGDIKIDALDARKLVLLCTRQRCTTQ